MSHLYRKIGNVDIRSVPARDVAVSDREDAIRLYSTTADEAWSLQIRGNRKLADGARSKDFMIAVASLNRDDMLALRASIDFHLEEYAMFREDRKDGDRKDSEDRAAEPPQSTSAWSPIDPIDWARMQDDADGTVKLSCGALVAILRPKSYPPAYSVFPHDNPKLLLHYGDLPLGDLFVALQVKATTGSWSQFMTSDTPGETGADHLVSPIRGQLQVGDCVSWVHFPRDGLGRAFRIPAVVAVVGSASAESDGQIVSIEAGILGSRAVVRRAVRLTSLLVSSEIAARRPIPPRGAVETRDRRRGGSTGRRRSRTTRRRQ